MMYKQECLTWMRVMQADAERKEDAYSDASTLWASSIREVENETPKGYEIVADLIRNALTGMLKIKETVDTAKLYAWNHALDWAADNATMKYGDAVDSIGITNASEINRESILAGKKQINQ